MQDQEGDGEPAHHARRPMNAFLIFCKRHRSVVRDKYPNLENRSITKILGEWWANLDKEEKACYTGLAKQYKDAFFNANPDFKWYKLPAPPLRTLTSRPREVDKSPEHDDMELEKTNNNSTKLDFNKKDKLEEPKPLSMFTPGKLADEANMGSLSSLLATKTDTHSNPYYSPISSDYRSHNLLKVTSREDNIRELQNALTETTRVFEDLDEEKSMYQYSAGDQFTNQDVIDQIVDKRLKDEDYQRNSSDDERNAKSGRSCKGKRYQEFMAVGGLKVNKRPKREYNDKNDDDTASPRREPSSSRSEDSACDDPKPSHTDNMPETDKIDSTYDGRPEPDNNANRTFKASDFDLDAKIKALPPLSLEKFQQKKRDNKRKKKTINLKPKALESSYIVNSVPRPFDRRMEAERWRATVIGSQKRKPRKISITRLEINSLVSRVEHEQSSPDMMIATEAPCTEAQCMEACSQPHAVDLFALATLAEVAANTSKLDDSRLAAGPSPV